MTAIEVALFDRFGVFEYDRLERTYRLFGGDPQHEPLFAQTIELAHAGAIPSVRTVFARRFDMSEAEWSRACVAKPRFDPQIVALTQRLRRRMHVGLLTNSSGDFPAADFVPHFDTLVVSSQVGVAKPAPGIYKVGARWFGVEPAACVMIDDNPRYCQGAQATGMRAIHYTSYDQLVRELIAMGVVVDD